MKKTTYKEPVTMHFTNMIVRVHRPVLTAEEHNRRMEEIKKAAVSLVLSEGNRNEK